VNTKKATTKKVSPKKTPNKKAEKKPALKKRKSGSKSEDSSSEDEPLSKKTKAPPTVCMGVSVIFSLASPHCFCISFCANVILHWSPDFGAGI
jgi:hypothetical protein